MEIVDRRTVFQEFGLLFGKALVSGDPIEEIFPNYKLPTLKKFLKKIRTERYQFGAVVAENNLMAGIKNLTQEQQLDDFEIYFPIYKAAQIKYQVPWFLLWIIHTHETVASRDPNPGASDYVGAMQRHALSWPDQEIYEAAQGWEFLDKLPQRYHQPRSIRINSFSVDYQEILWAASFLDRMAQLRYPKLDHEDGILAVVKYNYSAESHGIARVRKYYQLKEKFYPETTLDNP